MNDLATLKHKGKLLAPSSQPDLIKQACVCVCVCVYNIIGCATMDRWVWGGGGGTQALLFKA